MSITDNVKENLQNVNNNFEQDLKMEELRKELSKSFQQYKISISYMIADAPISILCLSPAVEKILLNHGCERVYDLFDLDFVKVKRLGTTRISEIKTRLDQFLSML